MRQAKTDWGELASHMCPVSCEQIQDGPPDLPPTAGALDIRIVPRGNPLIDLCQPALQVLFEHGQVLLNGLLEEREPRVRDQGLLRLPALIIQQIVLETAKADALSAKDVAGLQPSAEKQIDQ